ncbi:hypothetical protein GQX73_g9507 [Xylaria multiplex]|uniref:RING-type domain-containing protein n=1 Tax=Xylaria multiplex TaxID=323545 RepID=A0A7C8N180_9PEZI|nr:hypothetical protein GQX73_g9507 [Xylaria multiplex]
MEVAGSTKDTSPVNTQEVSKSVDPGLSEALENGMNLQVTDIGAVVDNSNLGAASHGKTGPTPQIKSEAEHDSADEQLSSSNLPHCTQAPGDDGVTSGEGFEDGVNHHTQIGQESDSCRSKNLRNSLRIPGEMAGPELGHSGIAYQRTDADPLRKENLFAFDETDFCQTHAPRIAEGNGEVIVGPTMSSMIWSSSEQLNSVNTERQDKGHHNPQASQLSQDIHSKDVPRGTTAQNIGLEATKEVDIESSARLQSEKKPRKKTGPRPKSAKEWFSKRRQELRKALPDLVGAKRKRSSGGGEDTTSRHKRRRRSKESETRESRKKSRAGKKSAKVMKAIFESLQHSNPIAARISLGDLPEADPIVAATKTSQLQQIMRKAPKDGNKRDIAADKKRLDEATRSFGYRNCVAKDGKWLIEGMNTPLYNHQVVGASWMLSREFSEEGPRGGILGDEMGMGKTLEALACIVSNRPTDDDIKTFSRATLIVTPANAIKQWEEEIRKHTNDCSVVHWKEIKRLVPEVFNCRDIILASYHEVSRQFPSKKLLDSCGSAEEWKLAYDENRGDLFKVTFWRIILDEAHNIKNKDSQTSIACRNLLGRHRWGMSGTPITNSLDEIYPYLNFLKTDWVGNIGDFQYLYGNPDDVESVNRLSVIMDIIMLRRTMADSFMGRPLYDIPICEITVRRVSLTKEERVIYSVVESRFRKIINAILKRLRAENRAVRLKDLKIYLRFLMWLRQGAAHPFLLERVLKKTLKQDDLCEIRRRLCDVSSQIPTFKQVGEWCAKSTIINDPTKQNQNLQNTSGNGQFGHEFNMGKQINIALASQREDVCRICYKEPRRVRKAKCKHIFCKKCLNNHIFDQFQRRAIPKCPECDTSLAGLDKYEQPDTRELKSQRYKFSTPERGRDIFEQHPRITRSRSEFLQQCDHDYPEPVVPSAKTIAVKEAILKWQSEAPDDKIIVFMEFKMTGAILGRVLNAEGIKFLYFFGDMSQVAKRNAVRAFHDQKHIKVMIASFRCGSVALNLTCANRVILVDLWWNTAIEMQAFARVFRIGQVKKTHFLRIIAQNTIDNRIEALQEKKLRNINKVMGPGGKEELSTEEIAALFGRLKKSEDGSFEVLSDDDGDDEFEEIEEVELYGDT